jgi:uncharacterized protein (DUF433 family)
MKSSACGACLGSCLRGGSFERAPRIADTGIEVFEVIGVWEAADGDWAALRRAFGFLSRHQLNAALHYYREYPQEVDARLAGHAHALQDVEREPASDPYHR